MNVNLQVKVLRNIKVKRKKTKQRKRVHEYLKVKVFRNIKVKRKKNLSRERQAKSPNDKCIRGIEGM